MLAALQDAWLRRGPVAWLLLPLTAIYALLSALHRGLYRAGLRHSERLPVPIVVVGNIVAGGAGKTPVVIAIARHLVARGVACGVVSRGHGRRATGCVQVTPASDPADVGDEPLLIASRCRIPVVVASRRVEAVRSLLAAHPQTRVVLSDDGLQHHAMARDVEVLVFDERGIGNGWLLPSGPLRERWPRRADLVVRHHKARGIPGFEVRRHLANEALRADGSRIPLAQLAGSPCAALAGIARPQAFFDMLKAAGLPLARTLALPDHHDFAGRGPDLPANLPLLCTEKDAVKLWKVRPDAWAVPLVVDIDAAFFAQLDALLEPKLSSAHGSQAA
jgi:tetraacyldisaccharide 4'-kinase